MFKSNKFLPEKGALEGWLGILRSSGNFMGQEGSQNKVGQKQRELEVPGKVYSSELQLSSRAGPQNPAFEGED